TITDQIKKDRSSKQDDSEFKTKLRCGQPSPARQHMVISVASSGPVQTATQDNKPVIKLKPKLGSEAEKSSSSMGRSDGKEWIQTSGMETPAAMDTRPSSQGWCASASDELGTPEKMGLTNRQRGRAAQWISSESHRGPSTSAFVKLDLVGERRWKWPTTLSKRRRSKGLEVTEADRHDGEAGRPPEGHGSGVPDSETKTRAAETIRTWW
ncbi:hypothetical protein HID58_062993, partial [Brassica napus]